MPRVSVLMPTHNRADVLGLAIQSVLDQTESDFELLVVADGCTDGTAALVRAIDDPRVRLFDLPKAPHFGYANRNVALREARGEFVAFAAHDDLLFPDHLGLLIAQLEADERDWIYSRPLWVSTDGVIVPYATNLTIADELEYFRTVANTIPASCVLYRRTCLDRDGYWPEDVASAADWRHWIAIIDGGQQRNLSYLATPTCLHFSAHWKQSRHSSVEEVRTWLELADDGAWWPKALRYAIPPGTPEQAVIAAAMRARGADWSGMVRAAAELVLDRVAWDDIRTVRPLLRARVSECQQLGSHLHAVERALSDAQQTLTAYAIRVKALEADLNAERSAAAAAHLATASAVGDAVERERTRALGELQATETQLRACEARLAGTLASTSWRITAPMRWLKHRITPQPRTSR